MLEDTGCNILFLKSFLVLHRLRHRVCSVGPWFTIVCICSLSWSLTLDRQDPFFALVIDTCSTNFSSFSGWHLGGNAKTTSRSPLIHGKSLVLEVLVGTGGCQDIGGRSQTLMRVLGTHSPRLRQVRWEMLLHRYVRPWCAFLSRFLIQQAV